MRPIIMLMRFSESTQENRINRIFVKIFNWL